MRFSCYSLFVFNPCNGFSYVLHAESVPEKQRRIFTSIFETEALVRFEHNRQANIITNAQPILQELLLNNTQNWNRNP